MPYRVGSSQTSPLRAGVAMAGGAGLAMVAGYVDAVLVAVTGRTVTHVTGSVAALGAEVSSQAWAAAGATLAVVAAFVLGACVCGIVIHGRSLKLGRRYGLVLLVEGGLLAGAALAADASVLLAASLAAMAAGLQNAMASTYMGLIVRTTHLTGIATDLGFLLGARLRGQRVEPWRFGLLVLLLAGFLAGVVLGAPMAAHFGADALWPAAGLVALAGSGYYAWRARSGS
ncbi:MAG: YoaK family protein [Phycisphaerales bacterium]